MSEHTPETKKYLESILDSLEAAILVVRLPEFRIEYANRSFFSVFGYESGQVTGKELSTLFNKEEDYKCVCAAATEDSGGAGREYELVRQDHRHVTVEIRFLLIAGESQKRERVVMTIKDVTAVRNAEAEKEKKQIQSLQMYKMEAIGRFTAGIAHDFNNLLTGIQGFSRLALKRVKDDDPVKPDLEQIAAASERAGVLTKQLLFFSRKQPMKSKNFLINGTIGNMATIMKWLVGENIKIKTDLAKETWPLQGNEIKIEQVIINLLLNARDAMPKGGNVIIKTENVDIDKSYVESFPEAKYGKFVCVTVQDSGAGMSKETLEHIFEPFFTTKEPGRGVGLGLFVAYGIIKQHEGWIDYGSTPGQGSVFEIYLPAMRLDEPFAPGGGGDGFPAGLPRQRPQDTGGRGRRACEAVYRPGSVHARLQGIRSRVGERGAGDIPERERDFRPCHSRYRAQRRDWPGARGSY